MEAVYFFETLVVATRLHSVQSEDSDSILPETLLPTYQTKLCHKDYKTNRQCQENFKCLIISRLVGQPIGCSAYCSRLRLKCDGTRTETRFRLSAKQTSPFKSAGASVQSTTGRRAVHLSLQGLYC